MKRVLYLSDSPGTNEKSMFKLKLPTDPRWANLAKENIEEILTDHAWCEQKAASNAITLITMLPEHTAIVTELLGIAQEELEHLRLVHEIIKERGYVLGRARKDDYVNDLAKFMIQGSRQDLIIDRMLFAAIIEARSCERFKVLTQTLQHDPQLQEFYHQLMISEAGHYATFIAFARELGDPDKVNKRWEQWLEHEAKVIQSYGKSQTIHG